jgi:5-methyltetrahydropteroyltriglutamate--homocysteine methyltransferase
LDLHVPFWLENETKLETDIKKHFAFAKEKLAELRELSIIAESTEFSDFAEYTKNRKFFASERLP